MKKWIAIIVSVVVIVFIALFLSTGGARNDVFLHGFEVSEDGKIMTLKVDVTSSAGYLRKMEQTSGSMNPYLTFYSTFGINSKLGAKDTYQIELDENMDEVYFYKGDRGYVKVLEKDKATGEWKIIRRNAETSDKSQKMTLDEMVSVALLEDNDSKYASGECKGEGHIILGSEEKENETFVYALTMYGEYGFQDGNFVKVSGSGVIPAVIVFSESAEGERNSRINWPQDGSMYVESIKEMFPKEYHDRVLKVSDVDNKTLKDQEIEYAKEYLAKIGRDAKIGEYGDFEHPLLTSMGVSVQVSNKLVEKSYANYPHWVGNQERIEDGVRYVYAMNYKKGSNPIILEKYNYETREVVEKIRINSLNGEEITLKKFLGPTGFAGSSFNRIELYSSGDVYWVQYDGAGFGYENIVKDVLVASNATNIEMFEDEGINVIGNNVKSTEVLNLGWLVFNK